ncbi:MAG: hypothetical protein A2268_07115 [Candidatus Raymondbacteria bacterium RifOxyA12_full_50_37]|uniref:Uncharacterized protein n=1 Tax=Candidatus Raymondbacteria bacterium RIFOXYD12_FULL_49_13 TaxID=1817890 RepID=A0A1F7FED0_UNCRA|nr:MAG: hypothetical protein A2350_11060 [Candidatus Raymondbacteria bacterium RifOxyB12_full_50_8]OGJ89745.1 MAG: hypothetical protein A2268_07115 [Candidatus Raymondbacteria bacterium RifOxyA12_full_50_37]OGJ91154.1 MAG: hypothetical protein A2248_01265 [Candidatus Raymondbacteria bacterium RIFOXYA2_FULL_49_16]OGJ97552.1 MAG: hypothetical protein A2453_02030 [Candidatus Raymondbacteria bacterium RIFOXYC2_FULL_50_21]OGK05025.1 MAG: hypothetical protein A2519_10145 [Candidatus Raymondbacteria b
MKSGTAALFLTGILLVALPAATNAYSFTAWTSMTGKKTLAINPFLYKPLSPTDNLSMDLVAAYGLSENKDIFVNFASMYLHPGTYASSWIMPRYNFGNNRTIALLVGSDGNNIFGGPQFHFLKESERFAVEVNVNGTMNSVFDAGLVSAVIAPVYKILPNVLHPYIEVDPSMDFTGSFALALVPGCWIGIPSTRHQASIAVPLTNMAGNGDICVGITLWYWYAFDFNN